MASRGRINQKEEQIQTEKEEEKEEEEERDGEEEEDEEEEGTLDDTTTYILYSSPTGALETRLLSHESLWSPSRKRKGEKSRSSSRHSSGDSDKYSRLDSNSFSQDATFGDQLSPSVASRLNKTGLSNGQDSSSKELFPEENNREMSIPESSGTETSSVTAIRLWQLSEKQEQEDTLVDEDDEDSRESEEDAVTTTTTTTTTTTMTTPKGTTQWTKTTIKTIWDDVDEEEEMEEVAVEVATPSTPLPSSTEAAVAAASAATKKAFSHSPDTRRKRREHRHSNKENDEEEYRAEEKQTQARSDQAGEWSEKIDDDNRGPTLDMDTMTKTTQYYDRGQMDSGRPKSLQLAGDHLGNVCLYRGNYGDVSRDLGERDEKDDRTVSTEVDMQYMSPDDDQDRQFLHSYPVFSADDWAERKDERFKYFSDNNEKCAQPKLKGDDYYMKIEVEEEEKVGNDREEEKVGKDRERKEEKEERRRGKERSGYDPSQHYQRQDIDVCQAFPRRSPDPHTSNYRSDVEVDGSGRVGDGFRLNGDQKETIINSSPARLGYQSTEFSSGYPPYSYPDNRGENVKEHRSTTSTTNSYVGVDSGQLQKDEGRATTIEWKEGEGQLQKDEGRATTIEWKEGELTTNPAENDSYSKDSELDRLGLTSNTNFDQEEDSNEEMYSADQGSHQSWDSTGSSRKYGGGQRGGNDDPRVSETSSPSHSRRQGSKETWTSGRHRKRRHKGRNRDRSRDSENSNDSSSGSNPVVQTHEGVGGSAKEFDCTHYEEQDNPRSVEEGDSATAIAVCTEHKEEDVHPTEEWTGKVEETKGGATSGHLWTTAAVGSDTGGKGRCTPSPEIDHSPTAGLPYKLYTGDYRRSYYDDGGGGGENSNNNNKHEREEKKLDEDNNNSNNANDEFCNVERETTRVAVIDSIVTSTHDTLEAKPARYTRTDDHHRQGDSGEKNTVLFSALYHGQTSDIAESRSFLEKQQLSSPSSPRSDYAVYKTQPDADYISSTAYTLQQNAPYANISSPIMDSQDDTKTNSDTNAIYTDNTATNNDVNANTSNMAANYELNNDSTTGEYSNNMDSNQADFGDFNGDPNLTATTSDAQWSEPNKERSPNADLNETTAIRDDYESYHREFAYAGENTSAVNVDFTSSFNAEETSKKMESTTANDAGEVTDFEEAPPAGEWAGYKESGTSNEQILSLNDEIAQADQNTYWNGSFDKEKDEDGPKAGWSEIETTGKKVDAWSPAGSDSHRDNGDTEDDKNKKYNKDYDKHFENEQADGQVDTGGSDDDYNQNYMDDSVENTGFDVEEGKDFSDTYDKEYDLTESRHDDSANDNYARQDDTEKYSRYDDDRPAETGFGDNQGYSCETADYGGDKSATYNSYYTSEHGIDNGGVVDNFDARHDEPGEDSDEPQEKIRDYKIEEEVDHKGDDVAYNIEQSPVEWGTSYTQDVKVDSYGPDVLDNAYCVDNNNMDYFDDQDDIRSHQEGVKGTGIDSATTEECSWQTAPSDLTEAKRPVDLHLTSMIYSETSPTVEQGVDYEQEPSVETSNIDYIVSPPREAVRSSPCDSPSQRKDEGEEVVAESPADRGIYWMDETTGGGTDQEGETLGEFQGDTVTAINVTSVSSTVIRDQTGTEVQEQVLMVHTDTAEVPIVPEIRSRIHTMYDGGRPSFDDSQYSPMYDSTNENLMIPLDSRGSSSMGPTWGSLSGQYEAEVEIGGVIEARQETVEETLIVPSIYDRNDRYPYGYSSMISNDVESRDILDSEGHLMAPVAVVESSDDLGDTTFPCGSSEYKHTSANDNNTLAATSVAGSFLDVPDNTEQKRWDSFESSKNKVPSTFGVEPHVERLRYGVMVRSGRAATSAGRKKEDQKPLIGSEWRPLDGKEFDERDGDSGFWTPDTENDDNQDTDTMPFGFGKKKKTAVIENTVSHLPEPSKEVENAKPVAEKVEEPAPSPEDATAENAEQVTVAEIVVEEETVVEVVPSDAVDGGTEQVVEIELVEGEKDEKEELNDKGSQTEEVTENMEGKDESTKEEVAMTEGPEVAMTEEPEVIDQVAVEENAMELVFRINAADLAVSQEVMSVDLNELEDDDEVAILDRIEMLGQPVEEPLPIEDVETIAEKIAVETPAPVVEKQAKNKPRVESTPLIGKQTKVKDTQPGFLCCTIL